MKTEIEEEKYLGEREREREREREKERKSSIKHTPASKTIVKK